MKRYSEEELILYLDEISSMSLEDINDLFNSIHITGDKLRLSESETNRSIKAITSMISKGVITAEDLKCQLAEGLPCAVTLMAEASFEARITLNSTPSAMFDIQIKGGLLSDKILPIFSLKLKERFNK